MKTLVTVVVPFYNEEENVEPLCAKIEEVFSGLADDYDYECLFVNDGSTDGTGARLDAAHERNPRIRPIHLARNQGQSAALVTGMRQAAGEYILTLDGDLQNDPCDFPAILELLKEYDCVCGYRATRRDTWVRRVSSKVGNAVRNWMLRDGIRDSGCGTKGFRRRCVDYIVPFNGVHRYFAAMVRNGGLTIAECPVSHHPRVHGRSKYGINNRLWRGIYDLIGVAWLRRRYVDPKVEGGE
ncbi:MAG: glycosyltransferase family 2 protein [Candidatus Hydrogenedentes bacterium]|nr:glycosyltransferase family 2 protein [Candidatus Hydrogenedentota bacterium]